MVNQIKPKGDKMKKLIFILMVGSLFAQDVDTSGMSEVEKQMLFKQNDKSPAFAGFCAMLYPALGHGYVGDVGRGYRPYILSASFYSSVILLVMLENEWLLDFDTAKPEFVDYTYYTLISTVIASLALWYPIQFQDAVYFAKLHNAELYEKIYGKKSIIQPKKSLVQKMIDKKEAKKNNN
jgi:hypothetical protein